MSRVLPAQRVLPASRVITTGRAIARRPSLGVYTTAEAGETLIPHLYDCYMYGAQISFGIVNESRLELSLSVGITFVSDTHGWHGIVRRASEHDYGWRLYHNPYFEEGRCTFAYQGEDGIKRWVLSLYKHEIPLWRHTHVALSFSISAGEAFIAQDGSVIRRASVSVPIGVNVQPVISEGGLYGVVSYITLFDRRLTGEEVFRMHRMAVVDISGSRIFFDPTFFDGTRYIDLSGSGNHGTPTGGVLRVPAIRTWMWRVRGLYSGDNKVRVLVPPMCRYRVGTGDWQVNSTWSTLELFLDPGLVSLVFEGL